MTRVVGVSVCSSMVKRMSKDRSSCQRLTISSTSSALRISSSHCAAALEDVLTCRVTSGARRLVCGERRLVCGKWCAVCGARCAVRGARELELAREHACECGHGGGVGRRAHFQHEPDAHVAPGRLREARAPFLRCDRFTLGVGADVVQHHPANSDGEACAPLSSAGPTRRPHEPSVHVLCGGATASLEARVCCEGLESCRVLTRSARPLT